MDLDVIFAYVVGTLAALAVIGALAYVVTWEVLAIRRMVAAYRRQRHQAPELPRIGTERGTLRAGGRKW